MTLDGSDPRRHPEAPPRSGSYEGLDVARRREQEKGQLALAAGTPEPGIYCRSHPLPADLGEPTEREYRTASPVLGLPVEILTWRDPNTGKVIKVFHRLRVGVHGFDD